MGRNSSLQGPPPSGRPAEARRSASVTLGVSTCCVSTIPPFPPYQPFTMAATDQIRQMVNFILQEAHEKANEIRVKVCQTCTCPLVGSTLNNNQRIRKQLHVVMPCAWMRSDDLFSIFVSSMMRENILRPLSKRHIIATKIEPLLRPSASSPYFIYSANFIG